MVLRSDGGRDRGVVLPLLVPHLRLLLCTPAHLVHTTVDAAVEHQSGQNDQVRGDPADSFPRFSGRFDIPAAREIRNFRGRLRSEKRNRPGVPAERRGARDQDLRPPRAARLARVPSSGQIHRNRQVGDKLHQEKSPERVLADQLLHARLRRFGFSSGHFVPNGDSPVFAHDAGQLRVRRQLDDQRRVDYFLLREQQEGDAGIVQESEDEQGEVAVRRQEELERLRQQEERHRTGGRDVIGQEERNCSLKFYFQNRYISLLFIRV